MEENDDNNTPNEITLHKIPLEGFINMLQMLYDNGADYVDIIAHPRAKRDVLTLIVRDDYIDQECNTFEEDKPSEATSPEPPLNLNDLV